ncbi:hypothetical protein ACQ86F_04540 [Streptomyces venezuelae ATCC 10712]
MALRFRAGRLIPGEQVGEPRRGSRQPEGAGADWRRPIRTERSAGRSVRRRRSAVANATRTPVQSSPVRWATEARSTRRPPPSP